MSKTFVKPDDFIDDHGRNVLNSDGLHNQTDRLSSTEKMQGEIAALICKYSWSLDDRQIDQLVGWLEAAKSNKGPATPLFTKGP